MIGRLPNVYEALYMQNLINNDKNHTLFPNLINKSDINRDIRNATFLGYKAASKYTLETTSKNNPEVGYVYALSTQKDISDVLQKTHNILKFPTNSMNTPQQVTQGNKKITVTKYTMVNSNKELPTKPENISIALGHTSNPFSFKSGKNTFILTKNVKNDNDAPKRLNKSNIFFEEYK